MANSALLISDDLARSEPVAAKLAQWLQVSSVGLTEFDENGDHDALFLLIDIDLSNREVIERFKNKFRSTATKTDRVFVTRQKFEAEIVRANALGAAATLPLRFSKTDLNKVLSRYAARPASKKRSNPDVFGETVAALVAGALKNGEAGNSTPSNGAGPTVHAAAMSDNTMEAGADIPAETARAVESIRSLHDSFYDAVASDRPLPKDRVISSCDQIIESLGEQSIGSWLRSVKQHDSYTYRHCMTVSGLAVSFAMDLGMRRSDVQRIGVSALMHDVGKVKIPLSILDKPGKLSRQERAEINKHPGYSAEIMRSDGQFDEEVIDIALHHHELLDGTGYPDGLTGDQISDPVRIMTIVDIYSALIDKRAYKDALSAEEAYQIQLDMGDKLDRDILRAFKPIASAVGQ